MPKLTSNFTKTLLQSYVVTNCERRIFFELGRNKSHLWFDPVRPIPQKLQKKGFFEGRETKKLFYQKWLPD